MVQTNGQVMKRELKEILSGNQAKLLKYWISKCENGELPERKGISPADLIFCLSNVSIIEQQTDGHFRFRLTATHLKDVLGTECRGRLVQEECGNEVPWAEAVRRCQKFGSPVFGSTPVGHRRAHFWMRLPLRPLEDNRQPILCYDNIAFDDDGLRRERRGQLGLPGRGVRRRAL